MDKRPLLSLIIITYNQEKFIEETITGALSQTYSPLEIIISDDNSTDNNFQTIERMVSEYSGSHKILINRNSRNLGMGEHINKALSLSNGELIIINGGDDISSPERAQVIYNEWITSKRKTVGFFSNVQLIDQNGQDLGIMFKSIPEYTKNLQSFLEKANQFSIRKQPLCWLLGCSAAIDRRIFDKFDMINKNVLQEDGVFAFRSLLLGDIQYIDSVLVKYRRHDNNIFDPTDSKKVLHLLKSEYFYKLQWYRDAVKIDADSKVIKTVKNIVTKAYLYNEFLKVPMLGRSVLYLKKIVKKVIS